MISHCEEDKQLEKFWSLESLGITQPTSINDKSNLSRKYQQSAISLEDDGSYTAKFPWKDDHPRIFLFVRNVPDQPYKDYAKVQSC